MTAQTKKGSSGAEPTKKESSMRWWEFYLVRYAMGTVVGAIIFYLWAQSDKDLKPLLFGVGETTLDATRLTILVAFGLVYCYIASGPILVFHAGRFLLKLDTKWWIKPLWVVINVTVPAVAAIAVYFRIDTGFTDHVVFATIGVYVFLQILWLQAVIVCRTMWNSAGLYEFYVKLSERREEATGEIMDSYRHLREHGNSFFIVFLEIVLAFVLVGARTIKLPPSGTTSGPMGTWVVPLGILVFWILPAVFVWLIGTLFERRFSEN